MRGNGPLEGEVKVQGSKNAALPMMAAAVLHEGRTVLHNCPRIADVFEMEAILRSMGVKTAWSGHTLELDCNKICETGIPGEETRTMRSSILLLGSMLGRCKRIRIGYPGGCTIGVWWSPASFTRWWRWGKPAFACNCRPRIVASNSKQPSRPSLRRGVNWVC